MELIHALFLGLLQGMAEWLPVSSQGQVMAFSLAFLKISAGEALKTAVFLHLGTVIAAAAYFRKELVKILRREDRKKTRFVAIALLSTAITAVPLYLFLKAFIEEFNPAALLALIALLLVLTGLLQARKRFAGKAELNGKNALLLGLGQGLSVLPGISRSGITSSILLFRGFRPEHAFHLSFFLSVPSVLAAELAFGAFEGFSFSRESLAALAASAIVGYASIAVLLKAAKKINFSKFCIGFGLFYVLLALAYLI